MRDLASLGLGIIGRDIMNSYGLTGHAVSVLCKLHEGQPEIYVFGVFTNVQITVWDPPIVLLVVSATYLSRIVYSQVLSS